MSHESDSPVETAATPGNHSTDVHQSYYDSAGDATVVETVLETLESASGRPADEMSVRLYDTVDPDALNDLFAPTHSGPRRDEGRVSFSVGEYAVTVQACGRVFVRRMG